MLISTAGLDDENESPHKDAKAEETSLHLPPRDCADQLHPFLDVGIAAGRIPEDADNALNSGH